MNIYILFSFVTLLVISSNLCIIHRFVSTCVSSATCIIISVTRANVITSDWLPNKQRGRTTHFFLSQWTQQLAHLCNSLRTILTGTAPPLLYNTPESSPFVIEK